MSGIPTRPRGSARGSGAAPPADDADTTDLRAPLVRALVRPAWVVCALLAVAFLAGLSLPPWARYLPLVASVLVLGLPHGAVDHLALSRVRGERPTPAAMARVGLLYALLGAAYVGAWAITPTASFLLFVALTWAHWGQGDVHALAVLHGADHLRTRGQRLATAAVRGGLPMLVPLVAFPARYRTVAETIVARFGATTAGLDPLFAPGSRLALGVGYGLLVAATLAVGFVRSRHPPGGDRRVAGLPLPRSWAIDAGEVALLVALFGTVPPVFAIGVYFTLWHSARHVARLILVDPAGRAAVRDGSVGAAVAEFGRDAAPLTAASIGLLAGAYLLVPARPADLPGLVGLYLVVIAALTLPHVVVVSDMDRVEGVWTPGTDGR